jgi:hypothetical protein
MMLLSPHHGSIRSDDILIKLIDTSEYPNHDPTSAHSLPHITTWERRLPILMPITAQISPKFNVVAAGLQQIARSADMVGDLDL